MEPKRIERAARRMRAALDDALLMQSQGQLVATSFAQNVQNAGELLEYGDFQPENEQERAALEAYTKCVALMGAIKAASAFSPAYADAAKAVAAIEEVQC
ncbi:MAG: hypothetical protein J6R18_05645 [Kiritimatiellae bacterium]|nr:hypothetical protein [Kiritimatiellia bacterium]